MKSNIMVMIIAVIVLMWLMVTGLNVYFTDTPDPELVIDSLDEDIPEPGLTPIPEAIVEPTVPVTVMNEPINETVNETMNESVSDTHSAAQMYEYGYYGGGSSSNSGSSRPTSPIPELSSFILVVVGIFCIVIIKYR